MKTKIHRRCRCGCGEITGLGKRYVQYHHGRCFSKETIRKLSLASMGNTSHLGHKHTKDTRLKMSLTRLKYDPSYEYCEAWNDREYVKDLRKDYCENADCKGIYKRLGDHHINLNKKDCRPSNIITLCTSCHSILHHQLGRKQFKKGESVNYKDFLTIIRKDKITYINKKTKKKIIIRRKQWEE